MFIGTQFSILYTSMYSPAGAATDYGWGVRVRRHLAHAEGVLYGMELGSVTLKINNQHTHALLAHAEGVPQGTRLGVLKNKQPTHTLFGNWAAGASYAGGSSSPGHSAAAVTVGLLGSPYSQYGIR